MIVSTGLVLASLAIPVSASAGSLVFIPPNTSDFQDLDHHYVYTWVIRNIDTLLPGGAASITGASLTFNNIRNWNESPNRLYLALLSEARETNATSVSNNVTTLLRIGNGDTNGNTNVSSSIYRIQDDPDLNNNTVTFRDDIAKDTAGSTPASRYTTAGQLLIPGVSTGVTALGNQFGVGNYGGSLTNMQEGWVKGAKGDSDESFDDVPETFTLNFNATALADLISYINNDGEIALGLDPDCHFFNDGIVFTIFTQDQQGGGAVPEPATLSMFGLGLAALYRRRRQMKNRA
jgi:hypothetical protein